MYAATLPWEGQAVPPGSGWVARLRSRLPQGGTLPAAMWERRHRAILVLLWLHVPLLVVFALASRHPLVHLWLELGRVLRPDIQTALPSFYGHEAATLPLALVWVAVAIALGWLGYVTTRRRQAVGTSTL